MLLLLLMDWMKTEIIVWIQVNRLHVVVINFYGTPTVNTFSYSGDGMVKGIWLIFGLLIL